MIYPPNPPGAAIRADLKAAPITGISFGTLTNWKARRDELGLDNGKFK